MTATTYGVILGDSQSDSDPGFATDGFNTWSGQLSKMLRDKGKNVRFRSMAKSGDTTAQILARAQDAFTYETPAVVVIHGGVNDPGASISTSTTQVNLQAIIKALKFKAIGDGLAGTPSVADQTALPAGGKPGQRYVVIADGSSTGGAPNNHPTQLTRITNGGAVLIADANSQKQSVWEYRSPFSGEMGWARVAVDAGALTGGANKATDPTHVKRVIVVDTNYLNFTTGGDTPSTPYTIYANVRTAQLAAATAENNVTTTGDGLTVQYVTHYANQRKMTVGGTVNATTVWAVTFTQGFIPNFSADTAILAQTSYDQTKSLHYDTNNQHYSLAGHWSTALSTVAAVDAVTTA